MKLYILEKNNTCTYYTESGEWKSEKENAKLMTWDEAEQLMYSLQREKDIKCTVTYK